MPLYETDKGGKNTVIGLLLLGGSHHILHLIPVAKTLMDRDGVTCRIYVTTAAEAAYCADVLEAMGAKPVPIDILTAPSFLRGISSKLSILVSNLKQLRNVDGLVVAERTSTILKRLPINLPPMFHIPHGAGDRARSYDKRIAMFDHVIVAGPKDKRRMVELKLVTDDTCSVSGYIKAAALKEISPNPSKLFEASKPIILYNPHFSDTLSSWQVHGETILNYFAKQTDYNLIFAPHIRLFSNASKAKFNSIMAYGQYENIHVDLDSDRLTDMTYTRAADIYLGDVSSQVYEFMIEPGPCIFIGRKKFDWANDPDYAHWRYGQVCFSFAELKAALAQAEAMQTTFKKIQIQGRDDAFGLANWDVLSRAADAILDNL